MTVDTRPAGRTAGIARFVAIGLACLVAGFVVGWFTRGDGGTATVLPAAASGPASPGTTTTSATSTATAPPTPPPLPQRSTITLAVLNGTTISGFAGQTATRAEGLGYPSPSAGNTPTITGPTVVYFRAGKRPAARRVAQDLGFTTIRQLPADGPVVTAAPDEADVVVVLGPG